jgi:demethylmenaquinone methyltransferase/2-methoxy-6-polyprenyl-1,4-benzoquinol methylase
MFDEVPRRYDLMNRLLTFRMDESWRKKAARICLKDNPSHIVDTCTGTGDLACHLARYNHIGARITALDFSEPMLAEARRKFARKKLTGVEFMYGDVSELPFESETIDVICIGFGFRNLTFKNVKSDIYLSEIFRVLKHGGKLIFIETSQPENKIIRFLYHLYLLIFVKYIGSFLSGNKKAYYYLSYSAIHFYSSDELHSLLQNKGFNYIHINNLFCGAAALTIAVK